MHCEVTQFAVAAANQNEADLCRHRVRRLCGFLVVAFLNTTTTIFENYFTIAFSLSPRSGVASHWTGRF